MGIVPTLAGRTAQGQLLVHTSLNGVVDAVAEGRDELRVVLRPQLTPCLYGRHQVSLQLLLALRHAPTLPLTCARTP